MEADKVVAINGFINFGDFFKMIVELWGVGDGEMFYVGGLGVCLWVEWIKPIASMVDDLHYYFQGNL